MVDDNFKKILFGLILTSLFSVLLIGSVITQGILYDRDTSEIQTSLNYHSFNTSINSVEQTSSNLRQNFEKQSIFSVIAGIIVTGIFDIAKSMVLMVTYPFSLVAGIMENVLHVPHIVASVLVGLITLSMIFGIWKLLKIGE